jgi:hypothetical protein
MMATIHLGALPDNTQYDIELQDGIQILTQDPAWCRVRIANCTTLRIDVGTVKTQQTHSFDVAFREHTTTYKFIGFPNIYL